LDVGRWGQQRDMESSRLEELLEQLASQNDAITEKLDDLIGVVTWINDELDWIGEHSFARVVVDRLDEMGSAMRDTGE
jgi:hypothetical protein